LSPASSQIAEIFSNISIPNRQNIIEESRFFCLKLTCDIEIYGSSGFEGISRTNGNQKPVWAMITA
jgi:hypothetical protein